MKITFKMAYKSHSLLYVLWSKKCNYIHLNSQPRECTNKHIQILSYILSCDFTC